MPRACFCLLLLHLVAPIPCNAFGTAPSEPFHLDESSLLTQHLDDGSGEPYLSWDKPSEGSDCPSWIAEYIEFHKQMRGKPDAKYLVNTGHFTGLGDRLRGVIASFQLAKAYKRVLLIQWEEMRLDPYLRPALLNWTVTPDLDVDVAQSVRLVNTIPSDNDELTLTHVKNGTVSQDARVWSLRTNQEVIQSDDPSLGGKIGRFATSWAGHCILNALFEPTPELVSETDKVQTQLLGSTTKPFVAVHLRMGHLGGETLPVHKYRYRFDRFEGVVASWHCATEYNGLLHANQSDPSSTASPILMMADNTVFRQMITKGMMSGTVGPGYVAQHVSQFQVSMPTAHDEIMSVFVDLMLLTRARCLVWSLSGFSAAAMAMAWTPCTVSVDYCVHHLFKNAGQSRRSMAGVPERWELGN